LRHKRTGRLGWGEEREKRGKRLTYFKQTWGKEKKEVQIIVENGGGITKDGRGEEGKKGAGILLRKRQRREKKGGGQDCRVRRKKK